MSDQKKTKIAVVYSYIKVLFLVLIFLQFLPGIIIKIKQNFEDAISPLPQIGYLPIQGQITNARNYIKRLEEFEKNENIKALILQIDSPGGYPGSSQVLFNEIIRFKSKKPVVAVVENMCASGAYYIASGADKIVASPSALVGSIGVVLNAPNVKELLESWKIKNVIVQSGSFKTMADPSKEVKDFELAFLQQISDDTYHQFIKDVAHQRGILLANFTEWADGKIFTGNQALVHSLIDQIGSYRDAIKIAKTLAGIKEEVKIVSSKKQLSGIYKIIFGDDEDNDTEMSVSHKISDFLAQIGFQIIDKVHCNVNTKKEIKTYL